MSHALPQALASPLAPVDNRPWYRQVNATQWRAFFASFLGWTLDGFDFTIISFLVADIQHSFTISKALRESFPDEPRWRGHIRYGLMRTTVMRRFRVPRPTVRPGPFRQ